MQKSILDRKYVIICNRHNGFTNSCLLFWGKYTEDNEQRSFGGYTSNFEKCEKYSLKEIKESDCKLPVYGIDLNHDNYSKFDDFAIEIRRIKSLGYSPMLIYTN